MDFILLDVGGVGYRVQVSLRVAASCAMGSTQTLWTHEAIREDAHELYGFLSREALELFWKLISVNGVGPKVGQKIIGASTVEEIRQGIAQGDDALFLRVSGVGKKTAQKIVLELRGSIDLQKMGMISTGETDVVDALVSLGYPSQEARALVLKLPAGLETLEEKIRAVLRQTA